MITKIKQETCTNDRKDETELRNLAGCVRETLSIVFMLHDYFGTNIYLPVC